MQFTEIKQNLLKWFESLGSDFSEREAALNKLVLHFYTKMESDVMVGFFFTGRDLAKVAGQQSQFMLYALGLKAQYQGRGPGSAHTALPPILVGHFNRRLQILQETLTEAGLEPAVVNSFVAFENSFRNVVIS